MTNNFSFGRIAKRLDKISKYRICFWLALGLGVYLRLRNVLFHSAQPNTDIYSYAIVADLISEGKSVYANTERYNYGPIWFSVLFLLKKLSLLLPGDAIWNLFSVVILFLTSVDIVISTILFSVFGFWPYFLFLIFPTSVGVTAFHGQFDNVAVLAGLTSFLLGFTELPLRFLPKAIVKNRQLLAPVFFGISLMVKHVLIFFVPWVLFYPFMSFRRRIGFVMVSLSVFLAGFVPWLFDPASRAGIMKHVVNYNSDTSKKTAISYLAELASPANIHRKLELAPGLIGNLSISSDKMTWILLLLLGGYLVMRRRPREAFFLYLPLMVGLAPAVANQYYAIPAMACAIYYRFAASWVYLLMTLPMGYWDLLTRVFPKANWPVTDAQKQFWLLVLFVSVLATPRRTAAALPGHPK